MLGFAKHRWLPAEGRNRINQVRRIERGAAFFALVAVCPFAFAIGACTSNVTVGQKLMVFFVVVLLGHLFDKLAFFIQIQEKLLGQLMVYLFGGAVIAIERYPELLKAVLDLRMVLIDDGPWCGTFFLGLDGDGGTVFVRSAHIHHVFAVEAKEADKDICGNISPRQMPNMQWTVGIRQCGGDGIPFKR